jgi:proliferating cell nuclear antigen
MFTAVFPSGGEILKNVIEIVKGDKQIEEAVFTISEGGIAMQSMDTSHVAVVDLHIHPDAADKFECDDVYKLGVNLESMSKIFKCDSSVGKCTLKHDPKKSDILVVSFQSQERKSVFSLKLLDLDTEMLDIPEDVEPNCKQKINAEKLRKTMKDLKELSEDVQITRRGDKLTFQSKGILKAGISAMMDLTVLDGDDFDGVESQQYSLKYLQWFVKGSTICEDALVAFDGAHPLLMLFENELVTLKFFLAPKIVDVDMGGGEDVDEQEEEEDDDVDE